MSVRMKTSQTHSAHGRTRLLSFLGALVATVALGCNDSRSGGGGDVGTVDADPGDPDVGSPDDAGGDAATDAVPETTVDVAPDLEPSEPTLVVVSLVPARAVYPVGLAITPSAVVYDQRAVPMDADVEWSVSPVGAATEADGRWTTQREGTLTFKGCIDLDDTGNLTLCGEKEVVVDAGSPTLEIFSPTAGQELLAEESPTIEVTGRAHDSHGALRVFVEGERVALDADGNFTAEVRPAYGVNHIEVVASDGLNGRETRQGVDVMWASSYLPTAPDPISGHVSESFPGAIAFSLGRAFLDADTRVVPEGEAMTVHTTDIAGLLQLVIESVDLMSYIPNPVSDSESFRLSIPNATLGTPEVDIHVTDRGLDLFVSLPSITLEMLGSIRLTDAPLSLDGSVVLVASAVATIHVEKRSATDPLIVEIETFDLALERAEPDFEADEINAIFELAEGALFTSVESVALDAVRESFLEDLPLVVQDAVTSIESSLADIEVPLDLGLGGAPVTLNVAGTLDSVRPVSRTRLQADFGLDVSTNVEPQWPDSRGVAMNSAYDREPPLWVSSRLQIAVRVPLLNGILHTLWSSGLLSLDATDFIPPELAFVLEGITIEGKLPPHLTPTLPDALDYPFVLSVGQLELTLWRGDRRDRVGVNLRVGADVDVIDGALVVSIQPEPTVEMWMIEQLGPQPIFDDIGALESLFVGAVWPMVTEQIEGGLVVDLPAIDLSSVATIAPALDDLTLSLVLDHPVEIREGYFVLDGGFDGTASLAP